ncbi:A24 family peptidase [Actinoalloteichus sp. AHMU CJ021]|uniref:A24 family peptidase n=1 Tax=Actinoalloteichus sp. AHMU CJ021 TaxID=2072503 RepID=UPI00267D675A
MLLAVHLALGAALGGGAATLGRRLLRRPPRGIRVPAPWCELALAALWAAALLRSATGDLPWWWLPVPLALGWLAVLLAATDLTDRRLPDALTLPAVPAALVVVWFAGALAPDPDMLARAALGGILLTGLYLVAHRWAPEALGLGDVKLAASTGTVLAAVSWPALLLGALGAVLVTGLAGALALLVGCGPRATLPHGLPMLGCAWLVTAWPVFG